MRNSVIWYAMCIVSGIFYGMFNAKRKQLVVQKEEISFWNERLAKKVQERTRELQDAQLEIAKSEKLSGIGRLSFGMAHEINNPLTVIMLSTQLLSDKMKGLKGKDTEKMKVWLTRINDASVRCKDIVSDMLEFSRSLVDPKLKIEECNIGKLLDIALSEREEIIKEAGVKVVKKYLKDIPVVYCDSSKMKEVFSNIVANAVQAMQKGGSLTLTTALDGQQVSIKVEDTGCGIDKENLCKIFDPFFTTKPKGTGLGLAITYSLISAHKGTIKISSEKDKGASVLIRLPLKQ